MGGRRRSVLGDGGRGPRADTGAVGAAHGGTNHAAHGGGRRGSAVRAYAGAGDGNRKQAAIQHIATFATQEWLDARHRLAREDPGERREQPLVAIYLGLEKCKADKQWCARCLHPDSQRVKGTWFWALQECNITSSAEQDAWLFERHRQATGRFQDWGYGAMWRS